MSQLDKACEAEMNYAFLRQSHAGPVEAVAVFRSAATNDPARGFEQGNDVSTQQCSRIALVVDVVVALETPMRSSKGPGSQVRTVEHALPASFTEPQIADELFPNNPRSPS